MVKNTPNDHGAAVPTMDSRGKRKWLYPDRRSGLYSNRRKYTALVLILVYLITPWLKWDGNPLLRIDVFEKKAFLFGLVLRVNETNLLALLLATLGLILLFATLIKGRIWCSYGCPQTVFVDWVIRPIEELIEGSAHKRRRIDQSPLSFESKIRKLVKHLLFLGVATVVANTFVSYFVGPERLIHWMTRPPTEHPAPFLVMIAVMFVFYGDLAWFREQFCAYLCPYARFQSVMIDNDTPTVAYNTQRGEPRGRGDQKGDCIDCQLCVRVCPTGIDIRNGLQLECVMCARCIDACNMVMTNLERPKGLISVVSQNQLMGQKVIPFWKRPKVIAYAVAIALFIVAGAMRTVGRRDIAINVIRTPGVPYTQMPDGRFGNVFIFQVSNNTSHVIKLDLVSKTAGAELLCGQCKDELAAHSEARISAIVAFEHKLSNQEISVEESTTQLNFSLPLIGPTQ